MAGPATILGPGGYPKPLYGSFAGKPAAMSGHFTVLGPGGYPEPPYASFAGKTPTTGTAIHANPFIATMGRLTTIA